MADWISDLIGGGASKIITATADAAKQFITTDADRAQFDLAVRKAELDVQKLSMDAESARLSDVQSAREMFKSDNRTQRLLALSFTVAYFLLTALMIAVIVSWLGPDGVKLPDWAVAFISTVFGAMSAKVSTIVDFFFGSSKGSHDKDEAIGQAFAQAKASN